MEVLAAEKAGSHGYSFFEACYSTLIALAGRQRNVQQQGKLGRIEKLDAEGR